MKRIICKWFGHNLPNNLRNSRKVNCARCGEFWFERILKGDKIEVDRNFGNIERGVLTKPVGVVLGFGWYGEYKNDDGEYRIYDTMFHNVKRI